MKKTFLLLIVILLIVHLMACDPGNFYFDYDKLEEEIIAVELINYDNANVKIVKNRREVLPFDFDKTETIETLETEHIDEFLQDLSTIHFHVSDNLTKYYNSASGISIRVVYSNGDFILICSTMDSNFVGIFDAAGNVKELFRFTNYQNYVNLVNKFFTTQIN